MVPPLPATTGFNRVRLLNGGSMPMMSKMLHKEYDGDETFRGYVWAFLISNTENTRHVLWDVGITDQPSDYIPSIQKVMQAMACSAPKDSLIDQLRTLGLEAQDIESVIFSHAHFDHCRPIAKEFPNAHGYFGPGTAEECRSKMEGFNDDAEIAHKFDPRLFDIETSTEKWSELSGPWSRFGPFEEAMDFFGDGTLYAIKAPGHMPGNLCGAVKVAEDQWILLGSDCAHTRQLLDGIYNIAEISQPNGKTWCIHSDIPTARDTISKIKALEVDHGVHIALGHDHTWMLASQKDPVLFGMLDQKLQEAIPRYIANGEPF
ncbi:Metallo-beta-lactamase [Elsinoe fawcettii]|nr:Metallo-beta-lactamase [Elsinoe fawcettii]